MTHFTVTIQLFEGTNSDYEILHRELSQASFILLASTETGNDYAVARKTYMRNGTMQEITNTVFTAARKTGKKFSFTLIRNDPHPPLHHGPFSQNSLVARNN